MTVSKFTDLALSIKQAQEKGSAISNLFQQPTQTFQEQYKVPERTPVAKDIGTKVLKGISNFTKSILQETARSGGSIAMSLMGEKELKPETGLLGKAQKFIFGERPLESLQTRIQKLPERAKEFGIPEKISKPLSVPIILGLTALDFTGWGGRAKTLSTLAKADKIADVIPVLKSIGIVDNVADDIAKQIIKTTDVNEIKALLKTTPDDVAKIVKPTIKITKEITEEVSKKTRGFIESAQEIIPKANKIAGQYIPRSTDDLAIKAKNLIKEDINLAEKIALSRSDDIAVATASELLKKYADDAAKTTDAGIASALYDKAAEVANTLAPKLTEQGRAIQAASILGRLTPEGQARFAAKEILRWNELNPLKAVPELTGEQTKFILGEMKTINEMVEGLEKAMRFQKLQNYIQDLVPTPLIKKITTIWKAGLLTGIKTQGLNIFANISHGITETVKDIPAAIVDNVASLFTGERTKVLTVRKTFEGIKEGTIKGLRYFSTGFDERNIAAKLDYKRVNFGVGKVAKIFKAYTETVFRALGSADQPFYYAALARSTMDQALAQGMNAGLKGKKLVEFANEIVKSPTEEMIRYAVADATTAVFQNQTFLGKAAQSIQKIPVVGEFILPFGRTPSAVAMQIINYSPVGIVKTIVENIGKGKFDQRLFSQGIGRGITGTGIIAVGMELAKKGLIALDYPQGDEREQELEKAEGVKNNAIKINDKWRNPIVLGPAGNLLLIGGHFQTALETEGSPSEALAKGVWGSAGSFLEQTFLTGIKNSVNAITDPERYAKSYLPNLIASFVPTIVSDVARATTPQEKRAETTLQKIQARLPGQRGKLEPQVDILGRERERIGNPLEVLIDPTRPSPETTTPITEELRRLMDAGFRVSPTALGDRKGYKVLTQEQNTDLWKLAGNITNDKLTSLFSKENYQKLPDDEKGKVVEKIIDQAKINARAGIALEITEDIQGDKLKEKLSELKEEGLLTRDVFNKYMELR